MRVHVPSISYKLVISSKIALFSMVAPSLVAIYIKMN